MKQALLFFLILLIAFSCKKTKFEPIGPTDVRIYNNTAYTFDNVVVNTSGGENNFGTIAPGTYSAYYRYDESYPKIHISLTIGGVAYSTPEPDYTFQTYLGQVKCTYKVFIANESTKTLDTDCVYEAPLDGK